MTLRRLVIIGLALATTGPPAPSLAEGFSNPGAVRTIYIAPMSHLDVGFTDTPAAVARKYVSAVDEAIDAARADPNYVWNVETFWQLQQWLDRPTSRARVGSLVTLIKTGRIGIGAAFVSPHPFVMGWPSLSRLCLPARRWGRRHGVTIDWACLNDVPGYPADLPAALAGQGIRYLLLGVNQTFTPRLPEAISDTPFWWAAPTGERVLTFIAADGYTAAYTRLGVDPGTARFFAHERFGKLEPMQIMEKGIGQVLRQRADVEYPFDAYLTMHAFDNWGSSAAKRLPTAAAEWNARHGDQVRLRITTPRAFFDHIERRYGDRLPVYRGGFGGEWDTLRVGIPTAMSRLRAAEAALTDNEAIDSRALQNVLVGYGHSNGLGPGWPKMFTLAQITEHNQWWARLAASYPDPTPPANRGKPATLGDTVHEPVSSNTLYRGHMFLFQFGLGQTPTPLEPRVWTALPPLRLPDGTLRLRHRIDRRELDDQTPVVWAWRLPPGDLNAKPRVETASGWVTLPDDDLRSDAPPSQWVSPRRTKFGRTTIGSNTILVFARKAARPGVLLALCLRQSRDAVLKDGTKQRLTFEQAYPGEDPVFELVIDVCGE